MRQHNTLHQLPVWFKHWWSRQRPATRALPDYLQRAVGNYFKYGNRQAAAMAYYAIFSIFPLSLLFTIAVSRVLGPVFAQEQISFILEPFLPPASADTMQLFMTNIAQAMEQSGSFTLIAIVGLTWSGLGLFSNITAALDMIFMTPSGRSMWRQRLTALGMAFVLLTLLVTSFVTTAVLGLLSALLVTAPSIWITIGIFFLPVGLNMVIFALLFRFVPARKVYWDAVWPTAILGALGWEIAKIAFGWFLTNFANYQFVYGAIATAIILLFWAYVIASIFLFCAELCAQLNEWLSEQVWQSEAELFLEGTATSRLPAQPRSEA